MINEKYQLWCEKATADPELITELKAIAGTRLQYLTHFIRILNSERAVFAAL